MTTQIITTIITLLTALGGWEAVKWFLTRKSNTRLAEAKADDSEFAVLAKTNIFLQEQLAKKEERFAEQTELVRTLTTENLALTAKVSRLETERSMKLCEVRGCQSRQPQSGY